MAQAILGVGITPWSVSPLHNRKRTQRFRTSHERSSSLRINDDILVRGQARWRYICTIKLTPHPHSRGSAEWATSAETSVECGNNVPYFQMSLCLSAVLLSHGRYRSTVRGSGCALQFLLENPKATQRLIFTEKGFHTSAAIRYRNLQRVKL